MKVKCLALAAAASLCCRGYGGSVAYEEEIPAFREGVDAYNVVGGSGAWEDGAFVVSVTNRPSFYMDYSRYPGMKPFPSPREVVLETEYEGLEGARAELVLTEFPGGKRNQFFAPLAGETRFKTDLDPAKKYQLLALGVHGVRHDGRPWKIGFRALHGIFGSTKAGALRIEAETGNPLHIVRGGMGERPVLVVRNASRERISARGVLEAKGFFEDAFEIPVDITLDGGKEARIPLDKIRDMPRKKGVWKIGGTLAADDGSEMEVETRFAVMDYHGKTPKQPRGTFRLGINWHIGRVTPEDLKLTAEAMVACGAKLARGDLASMSRIQHGGPDCWDFARTDRLVETAEENGIALDAIIFNNPKWAAMPENLTNANWTAWALSRPMPGTFERFCEGLSAHYGTRIYYYEIGNEWDLGFLKRGTLDDAVAIQREAYAGLKRGCPDVCVIPNGWAGGGDEPHVVKAGCAGFQEAFMEKARDYVDVHPVHIHGGFAPYVRLIKDGFFPLRKRAGVEDIPWYSNETAFPSTWGERSAALTMWKKILWAWANGSVDYIWYNLKGTGWDPKDTEQGFGIITADFHPRDTYVAFAALATTVGGGEFRRTILDDGSKYCYEFAKGGNIVLTAWDQFGAELSLPVATDATRAWLVDAMGNRTPLPLADGVATFSFSTDPCALILEGSTFAYPDTAVLRSVPAASTGVVSIPPDSPGRAPDFVLDRQNQVQDFFGGNPEQISRQWTGPKDNSGKVWLAKDKRGLRLRIEVEDDVHSQPFDGAEQYKGDDVQIALAAPSQGGQWEFGLAHRDDGRPAVHCWIAPSGFDEAEAAAWFQLRTSRSGTVTRYDALIPYAPSAGFAEKTLEDGIRFNLMLNDNDGDGRDATIEIVPDTFHSKDILLAPVIRFQ